MDYNCALRYTCKQKLFCKMWTETHQWWSPWFLCYFYTRCNDVFLYITARLSSQGYSLLFVFPLLVFFCLLFFLHLFLAIVKFWAQNSYTVLLMLKCMYLSYYVLQVSWLNFVFLFWFCFPSFSVIKRLGRWFFLVYYLSKKDRLRVRYVV